MRFTPKITKAINTAAILHDGQERKGDGLPYIVHPFSVALILMEYSQDEDVIVAGLLHDTIEDTGYTKEQMKEEFGPQVTSLVVDLTEPPKDFSWQERKDSYLRHLETACHESKLICAADKLHNLQSMLEAFRKFGEKAHEKFNAPTDKKLWFYEECLKIFRQDEKMPTKIIEDLETVLKDLKNQNKSLKETDLKDIYLGAIETEGGWDVKVYIINTSDEQKKLQLLQGSFQGDDEGLIDLGHSSYKEIIIPAKSSVEIDHMDDAGQLDFTTYYTLKVGHDEYIEQISGWSFSQDKLVNIPILNKKGYFSGFGKVGKIE